MPSWQHKPCCPWWNRKALGLEAADFCCIGMLNIGIWTYSMVESRHQARANRGICCNPMEIRSPGVWPPANSAPLASLAPWLCFGMPISAGVTSHGKTRFSQRSTWPKRGFEPPHGCCAQSAWPNESAHAIAPDLIGSIDRMVNIQA